MSPHRYCFHLILSLAIIVEISIGWAAQAQHGNGAASDPAKEFSDAYMEWKGLDKQINKLMLLSPRPPDEEGRSRLGKQIETLSIKAGEAYSKLRSAAMRAYAAEPNKEKKVIDFLIEQMAADVDGDKYEAAGEISKLLIDNGCKSSKLDALAGTTAYCLHDFDAAEKYLKRANEASPLEGTARFQLDWVANAKKLWQEELTLRKEQAKADDLPRVKLETSKGTIVVELFENEAPQAVANFIYLVDSKFYNSLTFHRVLANFMAQGGCPRGDGTGGPGYRIYCECFNENHRKHFRGTLSMAHAGRNTGGSQFFITFGPTPHLDGRHTAFGRVIKGLDVLADLQRIDPTSSRKVEPDRIIKATVIRRRNHEYKPTKVE